MSDNICALNNNKSYCLPDASLIIISKTFLNDDKLKPTEIIETLSEQVSCKEGDTLQEKELCILKELKDDGNKELSEAVTKQLIKYFKPKAKRLDGNYWLNNTEIDTVQYQLQSQFPGYYYSYIHMIDLKMFNPNTINYIVNGHKVYAIDEINFVDELNKKNNKLNYNGDLKYYGIVCNTDISSGNGIHWFSIFIDFTVKPITIEYFNSSGYSLIKGSHQNERNNFLKFFLNLADELTKNGFPAKFIQVTDLEHQREDTANCGSYSLFYIYSRLNGVKYEHFSKNKIYDENMESFRKDLWRKK